jgi:photosystem II stability/assembly factor-like uncharacterized protein
MPKDLTDVSQWNTVAVPVGTDSATAASVETPFQILTDRAKFLFDLTSDLREGNWFDDTDLTSVTGTDVPTCFCYDSSTKLYTLGTQNGNAVISTGGLIWDDEGGASPTGPNPGAGNHVTDIDSNNSGRRIACADDGSGDDVFYSTATGTWTACTITGTPGLTFETVGSNKVVGANDVWLIADSATPSAVYRSTDGITFSSVTVTGLTTRVRSILHTGDEDNDNWILMTDTQCARSSDKGINWTTASHGLSSTNQRGTVAYDCIRERFVVLIDGGRNVAYSDDFGATWTEVTSALPETITGGTRQLVSSDKGELLAWCGTASQIFTSHDGGLTWRRRYAPKVMNTLYCMPGWGEMFIWSKYSAGWTIQRALR